MRVLAAALAGALLFGVVEKVNGDPIGYTVSIGNAADQAEGDSPGQNHLSFPLTVAPGAASTDITVTYTVNGGSAQTTTIAKGSATAQLQMPIPGNTKAEDDQTYTLDITKVEFADATADTVAVGSPAEGKGKVIDDDWRIAGLVSDPANATVTEAGSKVIDFQMKLVDPQGESVNAPPNHTITVDYAVANGTPAGPGSAVNGTNYSVTDPAGNASGTLTFAPGANTVHVKVQSLDDGVHGLDKHFTVEIKNPQGATFAAAATTGEPGTITESDGPPIKYTVSIGNAPDQAEGDSPGQNHLSFPLTVAPGAASTDITVTYTVNGGSAQTTTIAKGSATAQLQMPIPGNTKAEDDQTYTLDITKVEFAHATTDTVAVGSPAEGKGKVIDDDWRIAGLVSDPANATVTEAGNKVIDFQMKLVDPQGASVNAPPNHTITVDYAVANGTPAGPGSAVNGTNYSVTDPAGNASGTLTFAPGANTVHVKVQSLDDGVHGLVDKHFTVEIKNPQGATFAAAATTGETGTITESDGPPIKYTVSIGNAPDQAEGDSPGQNHLSFPLTVAPGAASTDITVTYTVNGGSAQTTTIAKGSATAQLQMPIPGNTKAEDDQTYTLDITKVEFAHATTDAVAVGSPAEGKGKVIDDDWRIAGLVSDPANATVTEAGNKVIDFQMKLVDPQGASVNAPPNHKITVDYAVANGTPAGLGSAIDGTNYSVTDPAGNASGTLTFAPGANTVHVKVQSLDDGVYGLDKHFTVEIKNPQGATFAAAVTTGETGTITESEAAPIVGLSGCTGTVGAGGDAVFTLTDSFASLVPATFDWKTSDVSTVAGDYDGGSGTATIAAGNGNRTARITIHTHVNPPGADTRTFQLTVSHPQHATLLDGVDSLSATCDIVQPLGAGSEKQPSIQLTDPAPVPQPGTGSTPVTVTVKLNAPTVQPASPPQPVDVQWQTQPGTAVSPADYGDASGTLHWDKGVYGAQSLTVNVNAANGNATASKTFAIKFITNSAVFLGASAVTVTVVPPAAPPVLATSDASVLESAGSIPAVVSLAPAATGTITVNYATADGTAKAGSDYSAVSGTLTFTPGQTSRTIPIPISNDTTVEPNRTFTLNLSAPTGGATLGRASATITIRDDDVASPAPPIVGNGNDTQGPPVRVVPEGPKTDQSHLVQVQMVSGQSRVDAKGFAHYKLRCPVPAVKHCQGTIVLEVRVQAKKTQASKKAPTYKTVEVGSGKFTIAVNRTALVAIKVSKSGLALLKTYKRMRVKATVRANDAQGVKGVTAWLVSVQAPLRSPTVSPQSITVKKP